MTPHMEAIAFRIWQVAEPKGWDLTAHDIAEQIGVDARWVGRVASAKGWGTRLRTSLVYDDFWSASAPLYGPFTMGFDQ